MHNSKLLLGALIIGTLSLPVYSTELSDVKAPKNPSYRVGLTNYPERQYVQVAEEKENAPLIHKTQEQENTALSDATYADLSIKQLSKEVAQDLEFDEQDMVSDLSLLWQGAAMQSDTISFALYKLSNPDADKPDKNSLKKVLTQIAGMSTLVGAGISNPILAGSSLIGSNVLSIFSQDTKALNYKYTKVSDADMIILVRKIEDLQQKAVDLYYDYMNAKKQLDYATELAQDRQNKFQLAQKNNTSRELILITDAYYRTAMDKQRIAQSDFFSKRAALEQFVGNETFVQFENELATRENKENTEANTQEKTEQEVDTAYQNTIRSVEDYTKQYSNEEKSTEEVVSNDTTATTNYLTNNEENEKICENTVKLRGMDEDSTENTKSNKKTKAKKTSTKSSDSEKSTKKAEKVVKEKTPKKKINDKLIFVHNNDTTNKKGKTQNTTNTEQVQTQTTTQTTQQTQQVQQTNPYNYTNNQVSPQTQINNMYNLAPLDEIRVPQLYQGGYSIHDESY